VTDDDETGERVTGTFLVAETDDDGPGAVLMDAERGRVHAVADRSDLSAGDALAGELVADATGTVWEVAETAEQWSITLGESDEPPTEQAHERVPETVGELARVERAGEGELHVIRVPDADQAVADVLADEQSLRARAARLGVRRVEVRSAPGVVSVRYLP
jgi:hypothetical protein